MSKLSQELQRWRAEGTQILQLVALLVSIYVVSLPDPYRLSYVSARFGWFSTNDHVWDNLLHTDDRYRKSVLMKTSDLKSKRR